MEKEQIKGKINEAGQKIDAAGHKMDDWVEEKAEKHSFTKFQVWVGVLVASLALIGLAVLVW